MPLSAYTSPTALIPRGACDCHMHVFGPLEDFPPAAERTYTPQPALLGQYRAMASALGLDRTVFVQASAYGADNRCLLDAMAGFGPGARGIAGIDHSASDAELQRLNEKGVRGIRLNPASRGLRDPDEIKAQVRQAVDRIAPLGWHLQLFVSLDVIHSLSDFFTSLPLPVVFDHMGHARYETDVRSPKFQSFLRMLEGGKCWVKLAGADRISRSDLSGFSGALPKMRALIAANPDNLVWGTDWPHTGKHGHAVGSAPPPIEYRNLQTSELLDLLAEACGSPDTLKKVLVDNPARLYGFP